MTDLTDYKICIVGDIGTGKTCFAKRLTFNTFTENYKTTSEFDLYTKIIQNDDKIIKLNLCDIAGSERYGLTTKEYYEGSHGIFILVDYERYSTFEEAVKWKRILDTNWVKLYCCRTDPCILLINKIDKKKDDNFNINMDDFCEQNGFNCWFNISCKTGEGIDLAINKMMELLSSQNKLIFEEDKSEYYTPCKDKIFFTPENVKKGSNKTLRLIFDDSLKINNYDENISKIKCTLMDLYSDDKSSEFFANIDVNISNVFDSLHKIVIRTDINNENKCILIQNVILDHMKNSIQIQSNNNEEKIDDEPLYADILIGKTLKEAENLIKTNRVYNNPTDLTLIKYIIVRMMDNKIFGSMDNKNFGSISKNDIYDLSSILIVDINDGIITARHTKI